MATRIYCSTDHSRMGIEVINFEKSFNVESLKRLRVFRLRQGWSYNYVPSEKYKCRILELQKRVSKKLLNESMLSRVYRIKREEEEFENRCAVLAARMFNFQHAQ